jgi:hypothetical protein
LAQLAQQNAGDLSRHKHTQAAKQQQLKREHKDFSGGFHTFF